MTCTIQHDAPDWKAAGGLPASLCRRCHPELNTTPDAIAQAVAREQAQARAESERRTKERQLENTRRDVERMTARGGPEPGTVNAKILPSLQKKIARLEAELCPAGEW